MYAGVDTADKRNMFAGEIAEAAGGFPMTLPTSVEELRKVCVLNFNRGADQERERCAKIANSVSVAYESESPSRSAVAAHIEKRIRNGGL